MKKLFQNISWPSTAVLYFAFLSVGLLAIAIASLYSMYRANARVSSSAATNIAIAMLPTAVQAADPTAPVIVAAPSTQAVAATPIAAVPATAIRPTISPTVSEHSITATSSLTTTAEVIIRVTPSATITLLPAKTTSAQPAAKKPTSPTAAPTTHISATGVISYTFPVRASKVNYGRFHHDYPAADIFCPVDSEFVAPTSGIVDFVSREDVWDPGTDDPNYRGGLSVAIIGDDGWRYYGSHLTSVAEGIEPGVRVSTGQLLGHTGKSGDARFTPPHLHFGISHPTKPDDWKTRRGEIAPYPYLQAWSRGEMLTPKP